MVQSLIKSQLAKLIGKAQIELTSRGNTAIKAALAGLAEGGTILIPEEAGWLTYKTIPWELGLQVVEIQCKDGKLNVSDLAARLEKIKPKALLYSNPAGYFAEQDVEKIYHLCQAHGCLVILDITGGIGLNLPIFADIVVGSFGKWKPINAGGGGFIATSGNDNFEFTPIDVNLLPVVAQKISELPERIGKLLLARETIISDLQQMDIVHPNDLGLVVIIRYVNEQEKETIINYCKNNSLEWTECPRYIRLNDQAISIEVKRL